MTKYSDPTLINPGQITNTEINANAAIAGTKLASGWQKNVANGLFGLDANRDIPHIRPKAASANLRHSHDAEVNSGQTGGTPTYTKVKTFTFPLGIKGTLRIAFDFHKSGTLAVYAEVRKNGTLIGATQNTASGTYVTLSQDIAVTLNPGNTIELWIASDGDSPDNPSYARNFRISYDNAADTILVDGVTTS